MRTESRIRKIQTVKGTSHRCGVFLEKNMTEQNYIRYRKIKAFGNSICFYLCRIFPIKKKLISVCTFEGKGGFGCNPKYIVQELHKRNPEYEFVWFVNDMTKQFPDYIKKVPNTLWSKAYWLSRSRIWIDNYRKPLGTKKRKGQYYLNTNHYTLGIKSVGLWRGAAFSKMAYLVSKNDSDMINDLVIDSKFCEEMCPKGLVYGGTYLKMGAPRCDVLYGNRSAYQKAFREKYQLPESSKIVMFAPTFREGAKDGKRSIYLENWSIDLERLIRNLERKFGGVWYVCIRVHPQLAPVFKGYQNPKIQDRLLDESQADDLYEILAGMDAFVTDYSSACFEAGFAHMPVFIYADDIQQYVKDRGSLMWNFATDSLDHVTANREIFPDMDMVFPFPIAEDNEGLEKNIKAFDQVAYDAGLRTFHTEIELVFTGHASERLAKHIEEL